MFIDVLVVTFCTTGSISHAVAYVLKIKWWLNTFADFNKQLANCSHFASVCDITE